MSSPRLGGLLREMRRQVARVLGRPPEPDPATWERAEGLLNAALDLPPAERAAFLDRACAGAPALRREVDSLLAAHGRPSLIDRPAPERFEALIAPATIISHYRLLERLGGGGMGVVYKARDLRLERVVALKFLHPGFGADEAATRRFVVEAQAAAALDHPNICTIHEIGETEDGQLFIAMPCYEGETLKDRADREPPLPAEALELAIQVANGLANAHERGIVHRDIKPANLILTTSGVVKIVDFGVAKLTGVTLTRAGTVPGTIAYMSPEQILGEPTDGRSDIWSLGVVLYELLAGERPFQADHEHAAAFAIANSDVAPLDVRRAGMPAGLDGVVRRMLAKNPADRPPTMSDVARELERVRDAEPARSGAASGGLLPEGERKQVTIVVGRLGNFTDLVEKLAAGELERIEHRIESDAREIAERHGGLLNRCSADTLVLLFGIPAAQEDDCHRAVRAALELRDRAGALSREVEPRTGQTIRLQLGVDTGPLAVQPGGGSSREYRIAGAAMQAAEALAAHAAADEVWMAGECRRLVGPFFESEPRGSLALQGETQPVSLFTVLRPSGLQTRLEAAGKLGLTDYTGRDEELASLRRCLEETLRGEGQFVIVSGEAGLGKSRLLHEFSHAIEGERVRLLQARCQSYGSQIAYLPFVETLRGSLRLGEAERGRAELDEVVAGIRDASVELEGSIPLYLHLLSIPSEEFPVPKHLQGEEFRLAVQEALVALFTVWARREATVVLLEDWHWVDEASHAVLRQLVEVVSGYPLLVVATCRPGYLTDWGRVGNQLTQIQLRPLDPTASLAMLKSVLRADRVPEELGGLIHERTGGNPFFLEEICQTLLEEGTLRRDGRGVVFSGAPDSLHLPDTVQAVIGTRLDHLDRDAREVIRAASVIGREFNRGVLEHTLPGGARLAGALQTLKSAGLIQQTRVVPEPDYRFKHVLTQEVAYAGLLEHQRKELHGRVGAAIEQLHRDRLHEHFDRLADHFRRAGEWSRAARYGLRSAERADALSQFSEALHRLERARSCILRIPRGAPEQELLVEILLQEERLCETLGLRERQQRIIDELVALLEPAGEQSRLAEVYSRQGDVSTLLRRFDAAEEALNRSLRIRRGQADTVGERNTLRSLGLLRWHQGRDDEALALIEQALRIDRERGDIVAVVGDLANLGPVLREMGQYERARADLEEALRLSDRVEAGDHAAVVESELSFKRSYILQNLANIHREMGDNERALAYLHRARVQATAKRMPIQLSYHLTAIAHIYLQEGQVEECLRHYREAVQLTRRAKFVPGLAQSLRILGEVLLGLERDTEALPLLEEAAGLFSQLEDGATEAELWSKLGETRERRASHAEALAAWSRARTLYRQKADGAGELRAVEGIARVTRQHVAEPSLALGYLQEALALAEALGDRTVESRLRNTMGILEWGRGDYGRALSHYERGLVLCRELDDSANSGVLLNSIGVTLKALGRHPEARLRLEEAVAQHRSTGQRRLEGHALAALGDLWIEDSEIGKATECYQRSLSIRREIGDRRGEGWMLHQLARAHLLRGASPEGEELAAAAARMAAECGDMELSEACTHVLRRVRL